MEKRILGNRCESFLLKSYGSLPNLRYLQLNLVYLGHESFRLEFFLLVSTILVQVDGFRFFLLLWFLNLLGTLIFIRWFYRDSIRTFFLVLVIYFFLCVTPKKVLAENF